MHTVMPLRRLFAAVLAVPLSLLAGCEGRGPSGSGTPLGACQAIAGGASSVTVTIDPACEGCSVENAQAAADGDFATYASVTVGPVTPLLVHDGVSLRATAQPGVAFPGGSWPTVFYAEATGFWEMFMYTWLAGTRQEQTEWELTGRDDGQGNGWRAQLADEAFDAVEVNVSSNDNVADITLRIQEICVNACFPGQDGTCQ